MIYESLVECPFCGHSNAVDIQLLPHPELVVLDEAFLGDAAGHGWGRLPRQERLGGLARRGQRVGRLVE